jgi:transmembrane sensor
MNGRETDQGNERVPDSMLEQAASWLARRDRGLSQAEQDAYLEWLQSDPRHAEALKRCAATLERMMRLYEWQPSHTSEPNENLFAPARRRFGWGNAGLATLAAAAAVALAVFWQQPADPGGDDTLVAHPYLRVNERIALPDGSRVELNQDCQVVVRYSEKERRVQLAHGEAHFTVWKDASRPFVVEVAGVEVVAIGTSFSVRRGARDVEVLVTSGTVRLGETEAKEMTPGAEAEATPPLLTAGYRAVVAPPALRTGGAAPLVVSSVTAEEINRALAWLAPRLQFHETRLEEAVAQFNRLNRHQLVLGDPALGELRIGGTFSPENVDAFVRLLELTLRISAEKRGDHETVLRRRL